MDDLGVPLFLETPVHSCLYLCTDGQSSPARWVLGTLSTCFAETDLGFLIWYLSNGFAMVSICFRFRYKSDPICISGSTSNLGPETKYEEDRFLDTMIMLNVQHSKFLSVTGSGSQSNLVCNINQDQNVLYNSHNPKVFSYAPQENKWGADIIYFCWFTSQQFAKKVLNHFFVV